MEDLPSGGNSFKKNLIIPTFIIFLGLSFLVQANSQAKNRENPDYFFGIYLSEIDKKEMGKKCNISSTWCQQHEKNQKENTRELFYRNLLRGYPIEEMASYLAKQDMRVASFLIAIAKKESNWGRRSPQKNGKICYNFWGYKGRYNQTKSGYSCFDSAQQATQIVGGRIRELLDKGINTPEKMLVWKCGSSCAAHDPVGVAKWVSDVKSVLISLNS